VRFGLLFEPNSAAFYRAIDPMEAMERRGHEIAWPEDSGLARAGLLASCDMVHVYRCAGDGVRRILTEVTRAGTPITYDNDDDFTAVPKESPDYKKVGGPTGRRIHGMTVETARTAAVFTTTTGALAEKYRADGVDRIEVIPNQLLAGAERPQVRHDGLVIGWVGGIDHRADVLRIPIADALRRLVETYPEVRVECIGVDLQLPERYRHDGFVPFLDLPERIGGFDVAIAPLADMPANRARSDIKLKEYAASGVPWLASPVGPYASFGEAEGGRLVPDDGWFEALERLVTSRRERRKLGRKGRSWAKGQTIAAVADRWESVFLEAANSRASAAVSRRS
jgi:glycosyltransferase involved in cell wall biosynthesis